MKQIYNNTNGHKILQEKNTKALFTSRPLFLKYCTKELQGKQCYIDRCTLIARLLFHIPKEEL